MAHFFERRDRWGNSPALWIVALMVFLVPIGWRALQQAQLKNDVEHWLPADDPQLQVLEEARRLFPAQERILVSWDGSSLNDPRVDAFRRKIEGVIDAQGIQRGGLKEVAGIVDPNDLLREIQRQEVEPPEAVRRLHGVLLGAGPLRVKLTEAGRQRFRKTRTDLGKAVRKQFDVRLDVVGPTENLAELAAIPQPKNEGDEPLPAMPAAVMTPDGKLTTRDSLDHDLQLAWNGIAPGTPFTLEMVEFLREFRWRGDPSAAGDVPLIEDCFFVVGSPVALAVNLSEAGVADKPQTIRALRAAAEAVGIPPETLKLGGAAVSEVAFNQLAANAVWNPAQPLTSPSKRSAIILAALVGAGMTFLMLRSVRLTVLMIVAALYVACLTTACIPATGTSMNLLLAVLPTILMTWTIAAGLQVIHQWKRSLATNPDSAVIDACRSTATPCAMAGVMLMITCLAYCASPLAPVRGLGLFLAAGAAACLFMSLYGLPSLLQLTPLTMSPRWESNPASWRAYGQLLTIRPAAQAIAILAVCAVCAMGMKDLRTESKVTRYFPSTAGIVQDYEFLENQLAGVVPVELLIQFDPTAQEQANFLERLELVRRVEEKLRGHPAVTGCLSLADFQPQAEIPPRDAGLLTVTRHHKRASALERQVQDGAIAGSTSWYRQIPGEPAEGAMIDRQLAPPGEELWRMTAQVLVLSPADFATILADIERISREVLRYQPGSQHVLTGSVPLFLRTQQAMLASLIRGSLFGLAILGVAFVIILRNPWAGLVAMTATVLPILVIQGLLGWCRLPVDAGVIMASMIAAGISVPATVCLLTVFRRKLADGTPRSAAVLAALEACGPAIWQACAVVAASMAMLAPAELALISRFGIITTATTLAVLASETLLLPQLLLTPLGALFGPPAPPAPRSPREHAGQTAVPPPHLSTSNLRLPTG